MLDKIKIIEPLNETLDKDGKHILVNPKNLNLNTPARLQPLVMFVGGALDSTFKPVLDQVFETYNQNYEYYQDIGYATYRAKKALKALVLYWLAGGQKVVLVGHSYGGHTVMDVARELSELGKDIELVVTLDPVSTFSPRANQPKPKRVKRWYNVYVPYDRYRPKHDDFLHSETGYVAPEFKPHFANDVAMAGGPWERCLYADQNQSYFTGTGDEHARALSMFGFFSRYVKAVK